MADNSNIHLINQHIGVRIKRQRMIQNLSQEKLATKIRVTFQQLQKYERGVNRISAARLYQIAQALQVPVTWFLADYDHENATQPNGNDVDDREIDSLIKHFAMIQDPEKRCYALDIIKLYARGNRHK
ncbi:helix-turn-helix domain protein (plasmid) [Thalassoporum mexicanum PCC 7367]|uniref:helix-turn-helix domain-containing protein n=1 Tax=Thalassoporum mexicanum TaxID=3457544 RepID=UPI00029FFF3C|nr:helix-turn-helix transcriptional regulator [Pseudanabaena sp. PCC 7367]AFY71983.1 helix-turn-helix domain protein [Pseudanabaena sp. PCC 7367]